MNVLRPKTATPDMSPEDRDFLEKNTTWIRLRELWLYEGDFEMFADDELRHFDKVAEIEAETTAGLSDEQLAQLVNHIPS